MSINTKILEIYKMEDKLLQLYKEEKTCEYKHEMYSARDNGSIMRHIRPDKIKRKSDGVWTFGIKNSQGYMVLGTARVHQIVARAFHGNPPNEQYVVDHIDTNRCNNRPENLRWVTKLENALSNPITRRRIILICGSIENFLKNPSLLGESKADQNFGWMRTVSPEEAKISKERLEKWAEEDNRPTGNGQMGDWIFKHTPAPNKTSIQKDLKNLVNDIWNKHNSVAQEETDKTNDKIGYESAGNSLTPNVVQINWITPTEFPLCPQNPGDNPLQEYLDALTKDAVFARNDKWVSKVIKAGLNKDNIALFIITYSDSGVKGYALAKIEYDEKSGIFYHESRGSFFGEDGAEKYFTIERGYEWTGGDVFDDFC